MPHNKHPQPVENYSSAFFTTFGVLLFMAFWAIAAVAGFAWVVVTAWCIDVIGKQLVRPSD